MDGVAKVKPVIALKGGVTGDGTRAAFSHTGALWDSWNSGRHFLSRQAQSELKLDELMDTVYACLRLPAPKGKGISIITGSGGDGVVETDICIKIGFNVPQFKPETMAELRKIVPVAGTSIKNPLDAWQSFLSGSVLEAIKIVASDENIHSLILHIEGLHRFFKRKLPDFTEDFAKEFFKRFVETCSYVKVELQKPIAVCITQYPSGDMDEKYQRDAQMILDAGGIPTFPSVERAAKALFNLYRYGQARSSQRVESLH